MTALLELQLRRKVFAGAKPLFENVSFAVKPGERVAIMGPSGVGKTTLLTILAGLDRDFEGEVRSAPGTTLQIGVMFQAPRLMPWLTVGGNIALVMRPGPTDGRVAELLRAVELDGLQNAYPKSLSGGMQRRVALARALANDPHLLILDEPFVSLDDALSARLYERVLDKLPASVAVVMATHNLAEAVTLADRIVVLTGRPARLVADEQIPCGRPRTSEDVAPIAQRLRSFLRDA
jgi:ABC-type nitrate/sulfonate/bicarbonate transport system ATPase subunit